MSDAVSSNARAILKRAPELRNEALVPAVQALLADTTKGRENKYFRLVKLADKSMGQIAPNSPCRKGCNHCCHVAVPIMQHEAVRIARHTGREMANPRYEHTPDFVHDMKETNIKRFTGLPCTFLAADGSCSIYEARPLTCRAYHSIEASAEPCDVVKHPRGEVGSINLKPLEWAHTELYQTQAIADIRDWFPKE